MFSSASITCESIVTILVSLQAMLTRDVNEPLQARASLEHARKIGRSKMARLEMARLEFARAMKIFAR